MPDTLSQNNQTNSPLDSPDSLQNIELSDIARRFNNLNSTAKVLLGSSAIPFIPISELLDNGKRLTRSSIDVSQDNDYRIERFSEAKQEERESISGQHIPSVSYSPSFTPSSASPTTADPEIEEAVSSNFSYIPKFKEAPIDTSYSPHANYSPVFDENVASDVSEQQPWQQQQYQQEESPQKNQRGSFLRKTIPPALLLAGAVMLGIWGVDLYKDYQAEKLLNEELEALEPQDTVEVPRENDISSENSTADVDDFYQPKFSAETKSSHSKQSKVKNSFRSPYSNKKTSSSKDKTLSPQTKSSKSNKPNSKSRANITRPSYTSNTTQKKKVTTSSKPKTYNTASNTIDIKKDRYSLNGNVSSGIDPSLHYDSSSDAKIPTQAFSAEMFPVEISYVKKGEQVDNTSKTEQTYTSPYGDLRSDEVNSSSNFQSEAVERFRSKTPNSQVVLKSQNQYNSTLYKPATTSTTNNSSLKLDLNTPTTPDN